MRRKAINTTPLTQIVSEKLEEKRMSQTELSRIAGISVPNLNEMLAGRRNFSPKYLVRISMVLGLDAIELGRMQSDYDIMQVIESIMKGGEE